MARNLILVVAILAAGMFAAPSPAQTLSGPHDLEWTGWRVKINRLEFGSTFVPQITLKIIVGNNAFDAEDLDGSGVSYVSNIEPTLARERECYFELPRSVVKDSLI